MHINFSTPTLLYISYVPFILGVVIPLLPTMTMEIVDDSDPRIEYHPGSWIKNSNSSVDHGGTNHTTTEDASIQFQFDGILIQVFGTISAPIPRVQYKVDGQITGKLPQTLANTPNQILYQSEPLTPGNHTLIIAIDSNDPPFVFSLDYLVVVNTNHHPSSSASPTSGTTVVSTAAPENDLPHSKSQVNVGGVVGGVIAALVFLATLALCFLHWRRQHRVAVCHSITPFHIDSQMSQVPPASDPLPAIPPVDPRPASLHAPDGPLSHTGATLSSPISDAPLSHTGVTLSSPISPLSHSGATLLSPLSDDDLPPPFVAGNTRSDVARHLSMYKARSMESLPPPEYGYGGGLMLREWSRPQGHHGQ